MARINSYQAHERRELQGERFVLDLGGEGYPALLAASPKAPKRLYGIGDPAALSAKAIAIVGARRATPYGAMTAERFGAIAATRGLCVISGGARGCDARAHKGALDAGGLSVAVVAGGCDVPYPQANIAMFQRIVDSGGAVISEQDFAEPSMPYMFRARNRITAGLAEATLVLEAGLPSGTFSTVEEARYAGREVLAVPGPIDSEASWGTNELIRQGAILISGDECLKAELALLFDDRAIGRGEPLPADFDGKLRAAEQRAGLEASGRQGAPVRGHGLEGGR